MYRGESLNVFENLPPITDIRFNDELGQPLIGLQWQNRGSVLPKFAGKEIHHDKLLAVLLQREQLISLTPTFLKSLNLQNLKHNDYIKVDDSYFQPSIPGLHQFVNMKSRTCPMNLQTASCPSDSLTTFESELKDEDDAEHYFKSSDFTLQEPTNFSEVINNFEEIKNSNTFKWKQAPKNTKLYHWRSCIFDCKDPSLLPPVGTNIFTDKFIFTNTFPNWYYPTDQGVFNEHDEYGQAVLMEITLNSNTRVLHDTAPVEAIPCDIDNNKYHSDIVLLPSQFEVTCIEHLGYHPSYEDQRGAQIYKIILKHIQNLI
jgi:hypothetical protein